METVGLILYAIAVVAVAAGCDTDDLCECPGEMTLVGKAGVQADPGDGQALREQLPRMVDALLDEIGMGGKPDRCAKDPEEVEFAEAGRTGQFGEGDVFGKAGIEIFKGGCNRPVGAARSGGTDFLVPVPRYHLCEDG